MNVYVVLNSFDLNDGVEVYATNELAELRAEDLNVLSDHDLFNWVILERKVLCSIEVGEKLQ